MLLVGSRHTDTEGGSHDARATEAGARRVPPGGVWTRTLGDRALYAFVPLPTPRPSGTPSVVFYGPDGHELARIPLSSLRTRTRFLTPVPDDRGWDLGPLGVKTVIDLVRLRHG